MKCFAFKGVDPLIVSFKKVCLRSGAGTSRSKWVKSVQRRIHDHDVRALALADGKLISAGWHEIYPFTEHLNLFLLDCFGVAPLSIQGVSRLVDAEGDFVGLCDKKKFI